MFLQDILNSYHELLPIATVIATAMKYLFMVQAWAIPPQWAGSKLNFLLVQRMSCQCKIMLLPPPLHCSPLIPQNAALEDRGPLGTAQEANWGVYQKRREFRKVISALPLAENLVWIQLSVLTTLRTWVEKAVVKQRVWRQETQLCFWNSAGSGPAKCLNGN